MQVEQALSASKDGEANRLPPTVLLELLDEALEQHVRSLMAASATPTPSITAEPPATALAAPAISGAASPPPQPEPFVPGDRVLPVFVPWGALKAL